MQDARCDLRTSNAQGNIKSKQKVAGNGVVAMQKTASANATDDSHFVAAASTRA
jgi:hypothetical protein